MGIDKAIVKEGRQSFNNDSHLFGKRKFCFCGEETG